MSLGLRVWRNLWEDSSESKEFWGLWRDKPLFYVAGFPCKAFSTLRHRTKLLRDKEARPFYGVRARIADLQPVISVLENVGGLKRAPCCQMSERERERERERREERESERERERKRERKRMGERDGEDDYP